MLEGAFPLELALALDLLATAQLRGLLLAFGSRLERLLLARVIAFAIARLSHRTRWGIGLPIHGSLRLPPTALNGLEITQTLMGTDLDRIEPIIKQSTPCGDLLKATRDKKPLVAIDLLKHQIVSMLDPDLAHRSKRLSSLLGSGRRSWRPIAHHATRIEARPMQCPR